MYDCSKSVAWRADVALPLPRVLAYPKGNLQVWHVSRSGFEDKGATAELLALAEAARSGKVCAGDVKPKVEAAPVEASADGPRALGRTVNMKDAGDIPTRKRPHAVDVTYRGGTQKAPKPRK